MPAVVFVVAFAPWLLTVAFSRDFRSADLPLDIQMVGDVLRTVGWVLGAVFLPMGLLRVWLGIGVATLAVQVGLSAALVGPLGLKGVATGYATAWAVNAGLGSWLARTRCDLRLERSTMRAVVAAILVSAAALALASTQSDYLVAGSGVILVAWFATTVRRSTMTALADTIRGAR